MNFRFYARPRLIAGINFIFIVFGLLFLLTFFHCSVAVVVVRKTTAREQCNEALQGGNLDVEISRPTIFYDLVLKKMFKATAATTATATTTLL